MHRTRLSAIALSISAVSTVRADLAFTDVTVQAGLDALHALDGPAGIAQEMSAGGAIGDFNNDGWQDIYFIAGGLEHDRLFLNNHDGTFTDHAQAWGLHDLGRHIGVGAVAADVNDDGFTDVYITSLGDPAAGGETGRHRLLINSGPDENGQHRFIERATHCGIATTSTSVPDGFGAALGDYDLDGDLDLAVAGWIEAASNVLFRNDGFDANRLPLFSNATPSITWEPRGPGGLNVKGFSPRFLDTDGDWRPEILWISDFRSSRYLRNDAQAGFTDITTASGTGLDENGMGITQGDFNNDGLIDFLVTAIYFPLDGIGTLGNRLYINQGGHVFAETAAAAGVNNGFWGWGVTAVDLDHDGDLDIAETNGWRDFLPFLDNSATLFLNNGDATFIESAAQHGMDHVSEGRGLARIDYDNDGDQDILIFSNLQRLTLLRNELDNESGWLRVFIDTRNRPELAPHGSGARVTATTNGQDQIRVLDIGPNYLVNDELSAHFGLETTETIDRLTVEFHDGTTLVLDDLQPNQTLIIEAPPCRADSASPLGLLDLADILLYVTAFAQGSRAADLVEPLGVVDISDLIEFVHQFSAGCP